MRERMANKYEQLEELEEKLERVNSKIESYGEKDRRHELRESIKTLGNEVCKMHQREGIMRAQIGKWEDKYAGRRETAFIEEAGDDEEDEYSWDFE